MPGIPLPNFQPSRFSSGGAVSADPAYGRAISIFVTTQQDSPIGNADEINGYDNWSLYSGTLKFDDGTDSGATCTLNGSAATPAPVDSSTGGSAGDKLYTRMRTFNNDHSDMFTVASIPFAKYDVVLHVGEYSYTTNSGTNLTLYMDVEVDGVARHTCCLRNGFSGTFSEAQRASIYTFGREETAKHLRWRDMTATSFAIGTGGAGTVVDNLFGITGIQIIERLDDVDDETQTYSKAQNFIGDSYTAGSWSQLVGIDLANSEKTIPSALNNSGEGSTTLATQSAVGTALDHTDSSLIWWDGHANSKGTISNDIALIQAVATSKGDDDWLFIGSIPVPADNGAAYVTYCDDMATAGVAAFGDNYYDPRPFLASLDPGDTSVGGLPASIYIGGADEHHITDEAKAALIAEIRSKIVAILS